MAVGKRVARFASVFLLLAGFPAFAQTGTPVPELQAVDRSVTAFMQKWNLPGGSIAITRAGRLIYARAFGWADVENKIPAQPDSRFRIASVSKVITAVAIVKLVEEGRLRLDAVVFGPDGILNDPAYAVIADARVKKITVRHLLQHAGGWDRDRSGDPMHVLDLLAQEMKNGPPLDGPATIRFMLGRPLDFDPGSRFVYSNFGYCILGRVIEKVTGLSYAAYVQKALLQPFGITQMAVAGPRLKDRASNEVRYYSSMGGGVVPSLFDPAERVAAPYALLNFSAIDASGGWIASASDLARWLTAVAGFPTRPGILQPQTLALMTPRPPAVPLGWEVNDEGNWWHMGWMPGTSSEIVRTANGLNWVLLFNGDGVNGPAMLDDLDRVIWNGLQNVRRWPDRDLFVQ